MDHFFKRIIKKQEEIEKLKQEIKELDSKIEQIKKEQTKIFNELLKENQKLTDITKKDRIDNIESLINLTSILIFILSVGGSLFYITKIELFLDMIINTIKCLIAIIFINGTNLILNRIGNFLIKKYFIKIKEKNKLAIEQQENKIKILLAKNNAIEKTLSSYRNKKYNILESIQKEKSEIAKINDILIDELAPLLDILIEEQINQENKNIKQAIDNIERKLKIDKVN